MQEVQEPEEEEEEDISAADGEGLESQEDDLSSGKLSEERSCSRIGWSS